MTKMNDQRSLTDQLRDLIVLANRAGLYDAADVVEKLLNPEPGVKSESEPGRKRERTPGLAGQLEVFRNALQAMIDAHCMAHNFASVTITLDTRGHRYVRVVRRSAGVGADVWGFIDKVSGDILKAASWSAPAKHARGNIYNENPLQGCTPYGPHYLR